MVASTSIQLSEKSQKGFLAYYQNLQSIQNTTRLQTRSKLERIDREYQRELDESLANERAKNANRTGDPTRFQNMTVPVVMPQVEAAVIHQTSVFLTGSPLFGVVAGPEFIDEAIQMESVIEANSIKGGWAREIMMFFRDGFKHNLSYLEVDWNQEVTYSIETDTKKDIKRGIPKEVIWNGNTLKRLDPYNTFVDTRVAPAEVYRNGEFAGHTDFMSRIRLKAFIAALPDKIDANIKPAFQSNSASALGARAAGAMNYYVPDINRDVNEVDFKHAGTNWLAWAGLEQVGKKNAVDFKDGYEVTTLYVKILPEEFSLKTENKDMPQIYKLIIVNHSVIIYAEQQTNAHAYLPILVGQPKEDGLDYQTKSLADNGVPFQQLSTAYMSSIIASKRRSISDRVLYDPSRITSAAINSSNPSAKIPVKPAAYGKNISDAVFQFPYREDQNANSMQQISGIIGLSNTLAGQNQASQGQFVKGNRTLSEFESVMENANGNDQLASILLEYQVFIPMKLILKLNILQFQSGTTVFNRDKDIEIEIDPVKLRKAVLEFRVSDGLIPSSKLLNSESFAVALQVFGSSPQIAASYNVGQLFSYFMKTQGAKITEFEKSPEQVAFESALTQWNGLAQLAIEKGIDPQTLPPQPLPADFNYDPAANRPSPDTNLAGASQPGQQQAQQAQQQSELGAA